MKKLNDSISSPLRYVDGKRAIGQFYNSWDKKCHLAEYEPYKRPPTVYLCGGTGNFSASRDNHPRNICEQCFDKMKTKLPCGCHCSGGCGDPLAACMYPCAEHVPL
jgi:hypothetical protein